MLWLKNIFGILPATKELATKEDYWYSADSYCKKTIRCISRKVISENNRGKSEFEVKVRFADQWYDHEGYSHVSIEVPVFSWKLEFKAKLLATLNRHGYLVSDIVIADSDSTLTFNLSWR